MIQRKKNDELKDSIVICKSELDSLNKLDAKRKENKKLQEELDRVKDEMEKLKLAYNAPANNIKSDLTLTPKRNVEIENGTTQGIENDEVEKNDVNNQGNEAVETVSYVEKRNHQLSNQSMH